MTSTQFVSPLCLPKNVSIAFVKSGAKLFNYKIFTNGLLCGADNVCVFTTASTQVYVFEQEMSEVAPFARCWKDYSCFDVRLDDLVFWDDPGFVYMVQAVGSSRYKIGYSNDPLRRLAELKGSQPGQSPFELLHVGVSAFTPNMKALESAWHKTLCEFRVRGEWFELPDDLARSVCSRIDTPSLEIHEWIDAIGWEDILIWTHDSLQKISKERSVLRDFASSEFIFVKKNFFF